MVSIGLFVVTGGLQVGGLAPQADAAAGVNQQINFQARLLNAQGATVPDGNYNIQFKIYQDGTGCVVSGTSPCGGTLKWTETWLNNNTQGVTVKNGYFSVYLGAISSLASVDFNQDSLWLSLNVGNTLPTCIDMTAPQCNGDGEMLPFKRFASNPYALNSGKLGGLTGSQFIQLAQGVQADASTTNPSIFLNKTGTTANILELQKAGSDVFVVGNAGTVAINTNSTSGLTVQNGSNHAFEVDTSNIKVGIGVASASATSRLSIAGQGATNGITLGDGATGSANLYVSANDTLKTDDALTVTGILRANATGVTAISIADSGTQTSGITIGGDTNLYRNNAAGVLKTDGSFNAGNHLVAEAGNVYLQSNAGKLLFGSGSDTNLYRDPAGNTLKTDGALIVGGSVTSATYTGLAAVSVSSGGSSALTLDSASSSITIAAGDAISSSGQISTSRNGSGAGDATLAITGTTAPNATSSLVRIGGSITGGSTSGTYLGINAGSGFGGNLVDLQTNGASRLRINSFGDVTSTTSATGDPTGNASPASIGSSTSMTLSGGSPTTTNFDVGNYIKIASTNCSGAGVSTCYAKVTAKTATVLTISPALTWANNTTVTEYHVAELGGIDTSQALDNRFGRGYFISGVVTGNGTTYYNENEISTSVSSFDLLAGVGTINIGASAGANTINIGTTGQTTTNINGGLAITGSFNAGANTITGNGSGLTNLNASNLVQGTGAVTLQSGAGTGLTITANAASTFSTSSGALTVQSGSGTVSLGTSTILAANAALTVQSGGSSTLSFDSASGFVVTAAGDTLNAAAGLNTGAGNGTQRIDANGALSNISSIGLSGAITGATSTNTINNLVVNNGSLSNVGNITGAGAVTIASGASSALNLTGSAASTFDVGANALSLQTSNNGAITTGSGLFTQGGDMTFAGSAARTITGPGTGGLTLTVPSGPLTVRTTTSGTLAVTSAGALNLTGAAASLLDIGNNLLSLQTTGNGAITTGTGLLSLGGDVAGAGRIYLQGTTGTSGQGYFIRNPGLQNLAAFQALDLAGSTYSFLANNKYYNGSAWVDNGLGRVGSSFQIQNDSFVFYSFDTGTNFTARLSVASGGNVGIGTAAGQAKLHVVSTATPSTTYTGIDGTTATLGGAFLEQTVSDSSFTNPYRGSVNKTIANFATDPGAKSVLGGYNEVGTPSGNATALASLTLRANNNVVTHFGTGTLGTAGGLVTAIKNMSTGTITDAIALQGQIQNQSTGNMTNAYGLQISNLSNTGTIANTYGVYVGDITTGTQTNTPYSFYASDANALNFFAGELTASGGLVVGSKSIDATQELLQLDSFSTFADTAGCTTSSNQGAMYYSAASNGVRACVNGAWEDLTSTGGLGLITYGVVPDSGPGTGDIAASSGATNGPCRVSWLSTTTVKIVQGCVVYSGGRKVIVADNTTPTGTLTLTSGNFVHVCLTGANNQPAFSASGTEVANMPTWSSNNPIVCLADIKAGAGVISNIYDVRTFTTSVKSFVNAGANVGLGWMVAGGGTTNAVATTTTSVTGTTTTFLTVKGVVALYSGTTSTTTPNAILVSNGPQWVKATAGTLNQYVIPSATAGYVSSIAGATFFYQNVGAVLGVSARTLDAACNATTNCQYSQFLNPISVH